MRVTSLSVKAIDIMRSGGGSVEKPLQASAVPAHLEAREPLESVKDPTKVRGARAVLFCWAQGVAICRVGRS